MTYAIEHKRWLGAPRPYQYRHHRFSVLRRVLRIAVVLIIYQHQQPTFRWSNSNCHALAPTSTVASPHRRSVKRMRLTLFPSSSGTLHSWRHLDRTKKPKENNVYAHSSPLFASNDRRIRQQGRLQKNHAVSSSTALHMVLTTPESIIEQASTVNLLDDLIDESVRTSARRPIMMQFDPSSGWIWRRWAGTIFSETWTSCVRNMVFALCIYFIQRSYPSINRNLAGFGTLWGQLLSVTTFTLTFFVNQSYSLWRKCMELSRRLQGRLHDINMNLASHAARKMPSHPNEKSTYTASSRQILELMSRYVRLFNLLTYASFTRSHRPILTPRGMRRLVERGLMTATEREVLVDAAIPATQRHSVVLMWMIRLYVEGRDAGHIQGGAGFEQETMNKFHIIRSQYGAIGDELQGRMPLAYAHIVQVLVDLILWMFPIMAFSTGMSPLLVVVGSGLLTISYQGLFDLAKQFLDPYDNENYGKGEDPLCVDTLIAETNAGSVRWLYGFEEMPYSPQRVIDGELYDYLLPVRGYSVEELAQMEEERIEKEKQLEEQKKREEEAAERLRKESKEIEEKEKSLEEADKEVQIQTMEELVEELSVDPMEALQTSLNQVNVRKTIIVDSVNGNQTAVIKETVRQISSLSDPSQNAFSESSNGEMVNQTAREVPIGKDSARVVHKVTTLATGNPVRFKSAQNRKDMVEEPLPSDIQATNYLATLSERGSATKNPDTVKGFVPDLVPFETFEDLFQDENGQVGQEIRLDQQLVDESREENQKRVGGIREKRENESRNTKEVRSASGSKKPGPKSKERKKEDSKVVGMESFDGDGVSELGGTNHDDLNGRCVYSEKSHPENTTKIDGDGKNSTSLLLKIEKGKGSKEFISDEMLAEEEWESYTEPEERMTLDDYNKQVEEILTEAEKELRETEAILMSKPGADPLGWDYDDEKLIPMSDVSDADKETEPDDSVDRGKNGHDYSAALAMDSEESDKYFLSGNATISDPICSEETATVANGDSGLAHEKNATLTKGESKDEETLEEEAILLSKPGCDPVGWDYADEELLPMENTTHVIKLEENDKTIIDDTDHSSNDTIVDDDKELLSEQEKGVEEETPEDTNRTDFE